MKVCIINLLGQLKFKQILRNKTKNKETTTITFMLIVENVDGLNRNGSISLEATIYLVWSGKTFRKVKF